MWGLGRAVGACFAIGLGFGWAVTGPSAAWSQTGTTPPSEVVEPKSTATAVDVAIGKFITTLYNENTRVGRLAPVVFGETVGKNGQMIWLAGEAGMIVSSSDGGRTWRHFWTGTTENLMSVVVLDPVAVSLSYNGPTGFAIGDKGQVVLSRDWGRTWKLGPVLVPDTGKIEAAFHSIEPRSCSPMIDNGSKNQSEPIISDSIYNKCWVLNYIIKNEYFIWEYFGPLFIGGDKELLLEFSIKNKIWNLSFLKEEYFIDATRGIKETKKIIFSFDKNVINFYKKLIESEIFLQDKIASGHTYETTIGNGTGTSSGGEQNSEGGKDDPGQLFNAAGETEASKDSGDKGPAFTVRHSSKHLLARTLDDSNKTLKEYANCDENSDPKIKFENISNIEYVVIKEEGVKIKYKDNGAGENMWHHFDGTQNFYNCLAGKSEIGSPIWLVGLDRLTVLDETGKAVQALVHGQEQPRQSRYRFVTEPEMPSAPLGNLKSVALSDDGMEARVVGDDGLFYRTQRKAKHMVRIETNTDADLHKIYYDADARAGVILGKRKAHDAENGPVIKLYFQENPGLPKLADLELYTCKNFRYPKRQWGKWGAATVERAMEVKAACKEQRKQRRKHGSGAHSPR